MPQSTVEQTKPTGERTLSRLAPLATAGLALLLASPAAAHGGDGAHAAGPAGPLLLALIYLQLAACPLIGLMLLRQARDAWLGPVPQTKGIAS
ncbi:MAG: hypothetical protein ACRDHL_08875 [Candidatus Promineifilaceae bacterium]